ncbi:hypothetical protein ABA31_26840 [Agrococcus baldri]|uniref:Uncharacterized protein n=2 Tax=Agrococcus baldri TaxID=153730 RepID=A0AA87RLR6_9MICO|nr:hypothetical protein ABA31_26840 [Agrococcus baldri]
MRQAAGCAAAAALVLLVTACGQPGALAPTASPAGPQGSATAPASPPDASADPSAAATPAPSETAPTETTPVDSTPATVAPPRDRTPPPAIGLPDPGIEPQRLPIQGAAPVPRQRFDLYVLCRDEVTVWSDAAGQASSEFACEQPGELIVQAALDGGFGGIASVPEADVAAPVLWLVPQGEPLPPAARQQLADALAGVEALAAEVRCGEGAGTVTVGQGSATCSGGSGGRELPLVTVDTALATIGYDGGFDGRVVLLTS